MAEMKKVATRDSYGKALAALGAKYENLVVLDADLAGATKTGVFKKAFPDRFFDVGIAEEHAVTFAGGLAASGMKPVVFLYSTFAQRVYDQISHDIAIQKLPLVLAIDRAGLVPGDGITHQGIFDYPLFSSVPKSSPPFSFNA